MPEPATSLTPSPRVVHVEAQADHLESLARGKPIAALAELIWNALDSDADRVRVEVGDNDLGSPAVIEVIDNGSGISPEQAEAAFGNLGGSWKRSSPFTSRTKKRMHGRDGKGRFKAFALGYEVVWDTVYPDSSGILQQYSIRGRASQLQDFEIGAEQPAPPNRRQGTRVVVSNIQEPLGVLAQDGSGARQLAELFALYLCNYPTIEILLRGERVDPRSVQTSHECVDLPPLQLADGRSFAAKIDIVEWNFAKKERRICLCDADGYALHEVEAGIRPGSEFNFTAYLRSQYIAELAADNLLLLEELNQDLRRLVDDARAALRGYFRKRKAASAAELVQQWQKEGVYPFDGDAVDAVERARREVFDICALNVHHYLDSFRDGPTRDRQFTLRMLKTALDENPESLKRILTEVLGLPKDKQSELADLLQYTTLSAIIAASRLVGERLQFIAGLQALLFERESRRRLKERSQLHRMLEAETWIFGEEYLLTNSDENLTTVLEKHIAKLRPSSGRKRKQAPVVREDGSQGVVDLLLAREVPAYGSTRREYLVVELKRPAQRVDLEVKSQIESYALAVAADERFDRENTSWVFLAVSNEISDEAFRTVRQQGKVFGYFHDEPRLKIGLATWSEILGLCRARLEAFRMKLDYTATRDQGIALLHKKYAQYIPESAVDAECEESDEASVQA